MIPSLSRSTRRIAGALLLGALVSLLPSVSAFAGNGNNGTVKVHDGAIDPTPEVRNEPHVCTFHLSFFFADAGQTGDWSIDQQPPTGRATMVLSGSYLTDAGGHDRTVAYGLPAGHDKLDWDGRSDKNLKHKTFWVVCDNPAGPIVHQLPTTITTALNGIGPELFVPAGESVVDTATITGATAHAGGTVTYEIFSDAGCTVQVGSADVQAVTDGVAAPSTALTFSSGGTYYYVAADSGDADNQGSISPCGSEILTVNQES